MRIIFSLFLVFLLSIDIVRAKHHTKQHNIVQKILDISLENITIPKGRKNSNVENVAKLVEKIDSELNIPVDKIDSELAIPDDKDHNELAIPINDISNKTIPVEKVYDANQMICEVNAAVIRCRQVDVKSIQFTQSECDTINGIVTCEKEIDVP